MHQHLLMTTKHPFQQLYMPELNIPQGKTFCAIFFFYFSYLSLTTVLKYNMSLNSIYCKNPLGIILQSNSNTLMNKFCTLQSLTARYTGLYNLFFFCLQYLFFYSLDVQKFINLSVPEFTSKSQAYL